MKGKSHFARRALACLAVALICLSIGGSAVAQPSPPAPLPKGEGSGAVAAGNNSAIAQPSPPAPLPKGEGTSFGLPPKGEGSVFAGKPTDQGLSDLLTGGPKSWTSPEGLSSTLQVMLMLAVLSLAPAALLMTTCFVRIVVVLSLLRQALGAQNLPPTQVITTLSLFLTLLIMAPVWKQVYDEAIVPYTSHQISLEQAWRWAWRRCGDL